MQPRGRGGNGPLRACEHRLVVFFVLLGRRALDVGRERDYAYPVQQVFDGPLGVDPKNRAFRSPFQDLGSCLVSKLQDLSDDDVAFQQDFPNRCLQRPDQQHLDPSAA